MDVELMDLFATASVITAAQQTGLIRALLSGPRTVPSYAEELGLDRRATGLILDGLVTLDLASREKDAYDASPRVKDMLKGAWGPGGGGPLADLWSHTPEFLRTGKPLTRMDGSIAEREASYKVGVAWLARLMEPAAKELASKLESKLGKVPARVLDVGTGSGVWGLAIAERYPSTHVTGQDLPAVLESFMDRARTLGLAGRVATIPGDMHQAPLPAQSFDLVMIANVLRLESPERAASVLARLATAVAPGGALLVVDALAGGTPERERARALYAINLALRTGGGRVHSPAEITSWLKAAGLGQVEPIELSSRAEARGALGALVARK